MPSTSSTPITGTEHASSNPIAVPTLDAHGDAAHHPSITITRSPEPTDPRASTVDSTTRSMQTMSLSPMSSESMELGAASAPAVTDQDLLNQMHVREHAIGTGNASQLPSAPSPQSSVNTLTPTAAAAAEDHTPEHRHTTGSLTGFWAFTRRIQIQSKRRRAASRGSKREKLGKRKPCSQLHLKRILERRPDSKRKSKKRGTVSPRRVES